MSDEITALLRRNTGLARRTSTRVPRRSGAGRRVVLLLVVASVVLCIAYGLGFPY